MESAFVLNEPLSSEYLDGATASTPPDIMPARATPASPARLDPLTLASLPRTPGVYLFHGDGALPLYIGKSVDIRARVLSHLRNPDEAQMLAQARRVEFIETAGEVGALLLEASLIKRLQPLYNVRLRQLRGLCCIRLEPVGEGVQPQVVTGRLVRLGREEGLYGLFRSPHAARLKLQELADTHALCAILLGLEAPNARGCFGLQVHTCCGACVGREARADHDARLRAALASLLVHAWPYDGAIHLVEQSGDWVQKHRLQDWRYQGTWCSRTRQFTRRAQQRFDLDTYKILVKPLLLGPAVIEPA